MDQDQKAEHAAVLGECALLISNLRLAKEIAARQPPDRHSIAAQKFVADSVKELKRLRKRLEKKLAKYAWPEDQRAIANAEIAAVRLAEAEADGSASAVFS